MMEPKRGETWLVNLDPTVGAEIRKIRPALVISNDINNRYADTVTLLPISDRGEKVYPFEFALPARLCGLSKDSKVKCQQIRTVDKSRLIKKLGAIGPQELLSIEQALLIHLGIE